MIQGYILLPKESTTSYYGIDRELFEPLLIESEIIQHVSRKQYPTVSAFYPEGWRKTAYQLFESNVVALDDNCDILKDYSTAVEIKNIIDSHLGNHDIFFVEITDRSAKFNYSPLCFGYDFAYLGGDFYSAIKNGLFINPSEMLTDKYAAQLNPNGLFDDIKILDNYISDFKTEVASEENSIFWIYRLTKK
jgi:hypothetical protein